MKKMFSIQLSILMMVSLMVGLTVNTQAANIFTGTVNIQIDSEGQRRFEVGSYDYYFINVESDADADTFIKNQNSITWSCVDLGGNSVPSAVKIEKTPHTWNGMTINDTVKVTYLKYGVYHLTANVGWHVF